MDRNACVSEAVPPSRNRCLHSIFPKSRESLRFAGSACGAGNVNSPQPRLNVTVPIHRASVAENNLAAILSPNRSIGAKIPQLYPLWFIHRPESIGNSQQVQISDVKRPDERQCSPVWGEGWTTIAAPIHDCWRR